MFDIGWTELLVIGVVALVVVGPKDLPVMFKTFGRFMARARAMARDFSRAMETAADEAGIKDVANDIKSAASPMSTGIDRLKMAADRFEKWEPGKPGTTPPTGTAPTAGPTGAAGSASASAAAAPAVQPKTASAAAPSAAEVSSSAQASAMAAAVSTGAAAFMSSAPAEAADGGATDPKAQE